MWHRLELKIEDIYFHMKVEQILITRYVELGLMHSIEFGVHVPPEGLDFEQMKRLCLLAEEYGYSIFTVTDHFQNMSRPEGSTNHPLESWTLLGGLGAITSKIRLGTLVSCAMYRHPTVLAKMATTVDILSKGRTVFGIGAGWHQQEFRGFLGEFPSPTRRLDALEDALNIVKGMFAAERTNYEGKVFSADNTMNSPLPVQKPIPIIVGGGGMRRTLKIAAKYADICHLGFTWEGDPLMNRRLDALKEHCKTQGRDYNEVTKSISIMIDFDPTEANLEEYARRFSVFGDIPLDEAKKLVENQFSLDAFRNLINSCISRGITLFTNLYKNEKDIKLFAENVIAKI